MKKNVLLYPALFLFLAIFSCKKEFTDSVFTLVLIAGDNQKGMPSETLPEDVIVQVLRDGKAFFSAPVIFEVNSGFASPEKPATFSNKVAATDATGKVKIKWTLGCLGSQELKIKLGSPGCSQSELVGGTCTVLGEVTVRAEAEAQGGWTRACGFGVNPINFSRFNTKFLEIGDDLFVHVDNNVFVSKNDGVDWAPINTPFGPSQGFISAFTVGTNGKWYMAVFSNGVFASTDRGQTWATISINIFFSQPNRIFSQGDVILVNDSGNGLFRTDNNGSNWQQVDVNGSFFGNYSQILEAADGKWWLWDENITRLAKSTNQGETWTSVNVSVSLQAFPATFMTTNADGHILYFNQNSAKLMDFNPATGTGTVKSFLNNPSGANFVAFLQSVDGVNYVGTYNSQASLGIHTGTGNGSYSLIDPGTAELPEVFFRTKKERLIIGNQNGLFVKI